ncbi:MAG: FecR family protein [Terracidiphilus sp.]
MNRRGLAGDRSGAKVLGLAALAMGVVLLVPALRADDAAPRAARLSYVDGKVQIAQGSQLLADPALANAPLFEGSQVLTLEDGRAELQIDDGSVVRLSPNSSLTLAVLRGADGSGDAEIDLGGGLGYFELQGGSGGSQIRIRFGDSVVTAGGFVVLRVNLDTPPGELAVFSGNAHLERDHAMALDLHGGQSVTLSASDPSQYTVADSIEPDSWDTWNSDRDQALSSMAADRTGAAKSLPESNNPAWNDLDANGNWYNVPGQGNVWSPFEASNPGWDPYGNGYWMWTPRFGYIWVSGDSWGYMPFQCGAWNFYSDFGWGWAPGMCQPWWGGGGGWIFNIGLAPVRYRPPSRPVPLPPHSPIGRPMKGGLLSSPNATVAVNRRLPGGTEGLPTRDRNAIVTIGGHLVEPMRPVSARPQYNRPAMGQTARPQAGSTAATTLSGQRPAPGATSGGSHPVYSPPPRAPEPSHSSPPPSHPSSEGSAPSSHPSGGGGGGGGSSSNGHH